jgi:hypothetical protein
MNIAKLNLKNQLSKTSPIAASNYLRGGLSTSFMANGTTSVCLVDAIGIINI